MARRLHLKKGANSELQGREGPGIGGRMGKGILTAFAFAVSAAACGQNATYLRPGSGADIAPAGRGQGAIASDAGVQVEVRSRAWSGDPVNLETEITPLYVTLTNKSSHPVLVRYRDFDLTQGGVSYAAIPPYDIDEDVTEDYYFADYPYNGYRVAPHLARYYPRLRVADPFWWDDPYYHYWGSWPAYVTIDLPTRDMIEAALPEGVLMPGQQISGFLYFEELDDDISEVEFTVDLIDASTRAAFGQVAVPFVAY
jgi:hypothetical protein